VVAAAAGTEDSRMMSACTTGTGLFREPPRRVGVVDVDDLEDEKKRRMLEPNEPERVLCCGSSTRTSLIIHQQPKNRPMTSRVTRYVTSLRHQVNSQCSLHLVSEKRYSLLRSSDVRDDY